MIRRRCIHIAMLMLFTLTLLGVSQAQGNQNPNPSGGAGGANAAGGAGKQRSGDGSDKSKTGTANQTTYNPYDAIPQTVGAKHLDPTPDGAEDVFDTFLKDQSNGNKIWGLVNNTANNALQNGNVIIIHAAKWKSDKTYQPSKGVWAFYVLEKCKDSECDRFQQNYDLSGTPYLYNAPHIYFLDLNFFSQKLIDNSLNDDEKKKKEQEVAGQFNYQITTTARQKQNASDVATLVQSFLKLSTAAGGTGPKLLLAHPSYDIWYAFAEVSPSSPIPYDLAITVTVGKKEDSSGDSQHGKNDDGAKKDGPGHDATNGAGTKKPADETAAVPPAAFDAGNSGGDNPQRAAPAEGGDTQTKIGCADSQCSFSKTVTHYDPEYWDVSLGVSVPGVLEPKYKTATTSGVTTYSLDNPTRHTDAYAFVDIYAFQRVAGAPATLSSWPHFNFGIPISSQSLHRPYVGIAENLTFITKRIKLGIPLSVFAGPVFLKQQVYVPSTSGLKWDHAIKGMYGVELPISSITKYMKGGSNSSSGNKSSGSPSGSGS